MRMQLRTLHEVPDVFNELKRNSPECLQNEEGMRVEKRKKETVCHHDDCIVCSDSVVSMRVT